jgi:hypothetical protein
MTGERAKVQRPALPSGGRAVGFVFETTTSPSVASTSKPKVALMSGWSKQAKTRWASNGSNCV